MLFSKVLLALAPFWLATVAVTLYVGYTRPKACKIINSLLDKGCDSPENAKTVEELGLSAQETGRFLRKGSSLRHLVETKAPKEQEKAQDSYYIPVAKQEKAKNMYGKSNTGLWQSALGALGITVFFLLLGLLINWFVDMGLGEIFSPLLRF